MEPRGAAGREKYPQWMRAPSSQAGGVEVGGAGRAAGTGGSKPRSTGTQRPPHCAPAKNSVQLCRAAQEPPGGRAALPGVLRLHRVQPRGQRLLPALGGYQVPARPAVSLGCPFLAGNRAVLLCPLLLAGCVLRPDKTAGLLYSSSLSAASTKL